MRSLPIVCALCNEQMQMEGDSVCCAVHPDNCVPVARIEEVLTEAIAKMFELRLSDPMMVTLLRRAGVSVLCESGRIASVTLGAYEEEEEPE